MRHPLIASRRGLPDVNDLRVRRSAHRQQGTFLNESRPGGPARRSEVIILLIDEESVKPDPPTLPLRAFAIADCAIFRDPPTFMRDFATARLRDFRESLEASLGPGSDGGDGIDDSLRDLGSANGGLGGQIGSASSATKHQSHPTHDLRGFAGPSEALAKHRRE